VHLRSKFEFDRFLSEPFLAAPMGSSDPSRAGFNRNSEPFLIPRQPNGRFSTRQLSTQSDMRASRDSGGNSFIVRHERQKALGPLAPEKSLKFGNSSRVTADQDETKAVGFASGYHCSD
jgi:hypothetical protein